MNISKINNNYFIERAVQQTKSLDLSNNLITSLNGIDQFSSLIHLNLANNQVNIQE